MSGSGESFHIGIHARPNGVFVERSVQVDGIEIKTLDIPPQQLNTPLPVSFETAESRLAKLPRLFIEPDGSFVWVSGHDESSSWQVDGMMYDRDEHLMYVELKGSCPAASFRSLLAAVGEPETRFLVQLIRHAVLMDAEEYCRTRLTA
jgi:hypothetical protein